MLRAPGTRPRLPEARCAVFAYPGDLDTPTGGYAYDRRLIAGLETLGWQITRLPLGDGFPAPDTTVRAEAYARLAAQPAGIPLIVDGLALGVLPAIATHLAPAHELVAMLHHPLALESGLTTERAAELADSERRALAACRLVLTNSHTTAGILRRDFAVPESRIVIAVPGTDPAPLAELRPRDEVHLLSVGTLTPRKGHDLLIAALADLQHLRWRLTIVGDDSRDPATAASLRAAIAAAGLAGRITLTGAVAPEALPHHYLAADLFVLASRYEGFGMVYSEAIAHGLPVLGTRAGAIAEAVPDQAGLLVEPESVPALRDALAQLIGMPDQRLALAQRARHAAATLPRWQDTAAIVSAALARLGQGAAA